LYGGGVKSMGCMGWISQDSHRGKVWDSAIPKKKWFHLIVVEFGNFGLPVDGIPMVWEDG